MLTVGVGQDFKPHYQILSGERKKPSRIEGAAAESSGDRRIRPRIAKAKASANILQAAGIKNYKRVAPRKSQSHASAPGSARRVAGFPKVISRRNAVACIDRLVGIWSRQSCGA